MNEWYEQVPKRFSVKASRWPWQKGYSWRGSLTEAPLNPADPKTGAAARFGGGWRYCLGVRASTGDGYLHIYLELIFGAVSITCLTKAGVEKRKLSNAVTREYFAEREKVQAARAAEIARLAAEAAERKVPFTKKIVVENDDFPF